LVYDIDKTLKLYSGNSLVKVFPTATEITYLGLDAGFNARLETSNFTIKQMTTYGMAKSMMENATTMMQQENWHGASRIFSDIIENVGYHNFKVYYLNGYCQMEQNNMRTAIDNLTKAINLSSSMASEREDAYYLRGYCKAQLDDIDCVNDMRKAGKDGQIWLKENQLENFYPNQNPVTEKSTSSNISHAPKNLKTSKKPILKK
jgi:hypothetical protein